jgi:hypothetical protein
VPYPGLVPRNHYQAPHARASQGRTDLLFFHLCVDLRNLRMIRRCLSVNSAIVRGPYCRAEVVDVESGWYIGGGERQGNHAEARRRGEQKAKRRGDEEARTKTT